MITALFADLSGSTRLGELLDPEDFRDLTGGALARMGTAIEELGGTVRGTAGDGILGLFGAPTAHEDDAERAVIAGLNLVKEMGVYGAEVAKRWGVGLSVRVGIETGLAVLGEVRAGSQVQYDASGDCLNTAARLEGAAEVNRVLVGPLTHQLVSEVFDWGEPRPLTLKGKAEPVLARHARASRRDQPQRARGVDEGARLVGRDRELALAGELVTEVNAGKSRTVFVTGQAGIGKTRITRELRGLLLATTGSTRRTPTWLDGTCLSYGSDEPYLPFRQILRQVLGGAGSIVEVRDALVARIGSQRAAGVAPMLGLILGLAPENGEDTHLVALSAESLRRAVIEAVAELLIGLSEQGVVAVAIDDLHWADAASLRLVEGLVSDLSQELPVLLVLAMRPEQDGAAWRLRERILAHSPLSSSEIRMSSLDRTAERRLISDLVGEGTMPGELEELLLQRAEGNPFYLGELLRSLRDSGAIVPAGERWTFNHDVSVELPETVERVVLARLDRLPSNDRELLNSAAVIGREFEVPLLARIAGVELTDASLANLTGLGLIERATGAKYRFTHPLIQETADKGMLRRGRAELHRRAAAAIEDLVEAGSDEHYAVLARHHSAAGQHGAAVGFHRLAALAAQRVVALKEALNQFDSAIAAANSLDPTSAGLQLPELHQLRGHARLRNGDFDGGADDFRQALAGARRNDDGQMEMRALTDLGWTIRVHGYEEAISLHQQALRKAEELDDPPTQVTALSRMSMVYLNRLQLDRGLEMAQRALEIARAAGQDQLLGAALDCLKFAAYQLGDLRLLDRTVAEIIEVHGRTQDLYFVQWAYIEGAAAPLARGDLDRALELIDKAAEVSRRYVADRIGTAMILEARSWIDRAGGDLDAAVAALREAAETIAEVTTPEWSAWIEASLGSHLIKQGNAPAAVPVLESALAMSEAIKSPNRAFRAASHLAWARWLIADVEGSRTALLTAERLLATITAPPGAVFLDGYHSYVAVARTRQALGDVRGARGVLEPLLLAANRNGWRAAGREVSDVLAGLADESGGTVSGSAASAPLDRAR